MEQANELNFLTALMPLAVSLFFITIGVILLNQNFQKNLYRQMLKEEELKSGRQQDLLITIINTQEEKKRIAANLNHELEALIISCRHMVDLEQQLSRENKNALQNIRIPSEAAIKSMRKISQELLP